MTNKGAVEIWKPIAGYEGKYEVSNTGKVRSIKRTTTKGGELSIYKNPKNGYCYVCLYNGKKSISARVHVLVMNAFDPIDKKPGYDKIHTIDHIDGDKTNNALDNLDWCTQSENQLRAYSLGLQPIVGTKVINLDTLEIFETYTQAARSVGGNRGEMVARVCRGQRSHYREHHFAHLDDYLNGTVPEFSGRNTKKGSRSLWR